MVPFLLAGVGVVAAILLVVVITGGDDGGGGGSAGDLEAAVERFIEADSCPALAEATTESWQQDYLGRYSPPEGAEPADTFVDACQQVQDAGVTPIADGEDQMQEAEVESQDGDTAVVRATSLAAGQELDIAYTLVNEGGTWKVDRLGEPGAGGEGEEQAGGGGAEVPTLPEDGGGGGGSGSGGGGGADGMPEGARQDPDAPGGVAAEPDANGNLPEDVVTNFYQAAEDEDCELLQETLTSDAWLELFGASSEDEGMEACLAQPSASGSVTLESAEYNGILLEPSADLQAEGMRPNTAVVNVVSSEEPEGTDMWLIMEDGLWKVY